MAYTAEQHLACLADMGVPPDMLSAIAPDVNAATDIAARQEKAAAAVQGMGGSKLLPVQTDAQLPEGKQIVGNSPDTSSHVLQ